MAFVTRQSVLKEAGLWQREIGESLGTGDGSNKKFYAAHKPLSDYNADDSVTVTDVVLYVNGAPVTVTGINVTTGEIEAQSAPANGADVTADYSWQNVTDADVDTVIEEAEEAVTLALASITTIDENDVPVTVRKITRFYAAGLLMAREMGLQQTDETVKEGERKIKQAEKWITEYVALLAKNADDSNTPIAGRSNADVRLFQTYDSANSRWEPTADEQFSVERPE